MRVERRRRADDGTRVVLFAIALLVVGFLAFGGGYLLGSSGEDESAALQGPTPSVVATTSLSPSPISPSPSPEPDEVLTDGTYFIDVTRVLDGPPLTLEFDLAYYLTGSDAEQAAADHGVALDTDYYIVNDNPTLRQLPVSPIVQVRYVPEGACCELQPGLFDPWAAAVNAELQTDYAGTDAFWWIRVRDGEVVLIEEQFLP
jgi:hypothetical protein